MKIDLAMISNTAYITMTIPTILIANVVLTNITIPAIIINKEHSTVIVQSPDFTCFHIKVVWKFLIPETIIHIPKATLNIPVITSEQNRTITPNTAETKAIVKR